MSEVNIAAPDELCWQLLQAARARDWERHALLLAEIEQLEREASAGRMAHIIKVSRQDRLF